MSRWIDNKHRSGQFEYEISAIPDDLLDLHRSIPEYSSTSLVELPNLAKEFDIGSIYVKDESQRFGLKAFKALGSTYAVYRLIKELITSGKISPTSFYSGGVSLHEGEYTFTTATDGNHGRGVAWTARLLKQSAVIYMPENTAPARIENIRSEGAEVIVVSGDYDAAVEQCRHDAEKYGRMLISDTSWSVYERIPRWIQYGYLTLFDEIASSLGTQVQPDVVIVPGGVGALAASAAIYYRGIERNERVKLVCVEPEDAACLLESAATSTGSPVTASGDVNSIMAGLNCGTPSLISWPIIKSAYDYFIAIEDRHSELAMRTLYHSSGDDPRIISGESGAASMAALLTIINDESLSVARDSLGLDENTRLLILNTEGDTDPENFRRIVNDVF